MKEKLENISLDGVGEISLNEKGERYIKTPEGTIQLPILNKKLREKRYLLGHEVNYLLIIESVD